MTTNQVSFTPGTCLPAQCCSPLTVSLSSTGVVPITAPLPGLFDTAIILDSTALSPTLGKYLYEINTGAITFFEYYIQLAIPNGQFVFQKLTATIVYNCLFASYEYKTFAPGSAESMPPEVLYVQ